MSPNSEQNRNNEERSANSGLVVPSYSLLYTVLQILGLTLVFSVFYWIINFRGGFGFSEAKKLFNWHPMLNTIGFIFLFANSILHYRSFKNLTKQELKNQHVIIHCCIIVLVLLAGSAAFASHMYNKPPIPHLYSLHSWLGVLTITLFLTEFAVGFVSFLYPGVAVQYKKAIMPYHIYFGVSTFVLATATSVLGFGEKLIFSLSVEYQQYPKEGLFGNFLGVLCVVYGGLVVYMVTKPNYKRFPKPEDGVLLSTSTLE